MARRGLHIEELSDALAPKAEVPLAVQVFDSAQLPSHPGLPGTAQRDFAVGVGLLGTGEPLRAAECLERVLQIAPDFADGHVALGIAYAVKGKIYPAIAHLENAVKLEPDNFFAHFKLGHLYFKLRVPRQGYDQMERALGCATSMRERKLAADLIREERKREHGSIPRPWWNKPFSRNALYVAASAGAVVGIMLLRIMHLR